MKLLTYLFTLFFVFNAIAVAPYGFKGQQQSQILYSNVLQGQNNLVTNMGGINALLETGNKNILTNPSFEHVTFSTGWTNSAGTFTQETVLEIDGLKAAKLVLSSQTMSLTQSSTLYASQFADGVQGLASVRVKSDVALKVCAIQAGTVSSSLCVDVQANNKWGLYKVPFILGATSNGISIASSGAVSGTVYIDDAFVGAVDLAATVDASKIAGESYFAGTTSATCTKTGTSLGSVTCNAAFPGPTIVSSTMGSWQTTDSNLPRQTINNLPAGRYKAKFFVWGYMSGNNSTALAINDGTTTCEPVGGPSIVTGGTFATVECSFTYTQQGDRSFELLVGTSINTWTLDNSVTSPRISTKFILEYFGSGITYSSNNADTDWASCGHTTSDFTGFGTVSAIETQCKREGSDLLMRGKFTSGVPTAVEGRVNLKLGGISLTSKNSSSIASLQVSGITGINVAGSYSFVTLIEPSVSYITFGRQDASSSALTKANGSVLAGTGSLLSFHARIPIEGWENSNILIGQFNGLESCTDTYQCTDVYSAKVISGVVSDENIDWINGNCSFVANAYTCTFKTSLFSVTPNCQITSINGGVPEVRFAAATSASQAVVEMFTSAGSASSGSFSITCQKQGVDYIGKTAKAVASDQNLRTVGIINGEVFSFSFGTTNATTACTATPCSFLDQIGSTVSSVSRPGVGQYTINTSKTYSKLKCSGNYGQGSASFGGSIQCSNCNNVSFQTINASAVNIDTYGTIICHGIP